MRRHGRSKRTSSSLRPRGRGRTPRTAPIRLLRQRRPRRGATPPAPARAPSPVARLPPRIRTGAGRLRPAVMTQAPRYGWLDGRIVDWADACLHVDTQCVLGGLNAYEVVGAFRSRAGDNLYFFRLHEHLQRLRLSAKVMRLAVPYS